MPYETDPHVIAWFERSLTDARPMVRRRAVELLEYVECARREDWLVRAEADEHDRVAATAAIVGAILDARRHEAGFDLLESDFLDGCRASDLEWEWEYVVKVCRGPSVPCAGVLVWTRDEDDATARQLALLKSFPGEEPAADAVPVIVGKRAVTRYTRSPRSHHEAMLWHHDGRPRYNE